MITPNKITAFRIILTILLMIGLYAFYKDASFWTKMVFGVLWFLIVLMDSLDGYIARTRNLHSVYGVYLDYLADSLCMFALYIFMVEINIIPLWFVSLLLAREFFVSFIFRMSALKDVSLSSTSLGKCRIDLMGFLLVGVYWFQLLGGLRSDLWIFIPVLGFLFVIGNIFGYDKSYKNTIRIVTIIFSVALLVGGSSFDDVAHIYVVMALLLTVATLVEFIWQSRSYIFEPECFEGKEETTKKSETFSGTVN
jgi:phosphatidylglycerophosphate synthase